MVYIESYKLFESHVEIKSIDLENDIRDILLELSDISFKVEIKKYRFDEHLSIVIKKSNVRSGGIGKDEFIWKEVKDVIFRLIEYYYSTVGKVIKLSEIPKHPQVVKNNRLFSDEDKRKFPFRMFASGDYSWGRSETEFGIGLDKEEYFLNDFEFGDYTRFENLRLSIRIK